jgi:predicted permease
MKPRGIRRLFRFPSRSSRDVRKDVSEELAFHLDMRTERLIEEGLPADRARAQALREFGDVTRSATSLAAHGDREERKRGLSRAASDLRQDVRYGLRLIVRDKAFSIAAVLTLAVGIGGNTAVFSVVNALFFQPLAIRAPHAVVRIYPGSSTISWPNLEDIRERNTVFTDVVAQGNVLMSLASDPLPVRVSAGLVSLNYFSALGAGPLFGRGLLPSDRGSDVVVLGEVFWRTRLGGSPAIVGQTITLDGRARQVVGVMPRAFRGIAPAGFTRDLWIPIDVDRAHRGLAADRAAARFEAFGRLQPGVCVEQAAAAMQVVGARMATEQPDVNQRFTSTEVFAADGIGLFRGVGKTLLPVFVFVGFLAVVSAFVLGIGCVNLAGLLIGRAAARRQEITVRLALGAGRGRLVRQLLTESALLSLVGGVCGLGLAAALTSGISILAGRFPIPLDLNIALDLRVLAYAFGVSMVCAMLFGLIPARRASRVQLVDSLNGRGIGGNTRQRFRQVLLITQVAVSALLLFWSGLFARSLLHAGSVNPGFDPSGVLLAEIQLVDDGPDPSRRSDAAYVEIQNRVRQLPGVDAAGWSSVVPLALMGNERYRVSPSHAPADAPGTWIVASRLSPGWFAAVRIPVVTGRDFTWQDHEGSPRVAVVNETLARQFWNGNAVGQRLRAGTSTMEIVGVVRDSKYWTLGEEIAPTVYQPFRQVPASHPQTLHVRTANARVTAEQIRQVVHELVPGAAAAMTPMSDAVAVATVPARVGAIVMGAFGLLGAFLATLGIYGVISYIVVQRAREVAIRRAIGASTGHIIRVVVGSSAALALVGVVCGVAAGALSAPVLGGVLIDVSPRDPLVALATLLAVLGTATLASVPPALRATRVDALAALKAE